MNQSITYTPVYVGLLASLWLALLCNLYLDAMYGIFGIEVVIWSAVMIVTSWIGWRQRHHPWARGPAIRKFFLGMAFVAMILLFLPMWFVPRGLVYFIVAIQVANNTLPLTRKTLYYGLVIAIAIVMFASAHMRAGWDMLFYVLPFMVAVVFTVIAEQVSHQAAESRARSLGTAAAGREWIAIASASTAILIIAAVLYAVVPQWSWKELEWRRVVMTPGTVIPDKEGTGHATGIAVGKDRSAWRSPAELRKMAAIKWMPGWQSAAMEKLADLTEVLGAWWEPKKTFLGELLESLLEKLKSLGIDWLLLVATALLATGIVAYYREIRPLDWLRTRLDYARFGWLGWRDVRSNPAIALYRALERLGDYYGEPRPATRNAWEYLQQLRGTRSAIRTDLMLLTLAFEGARYGSGAHPSDWAKLRGAYRRIYRSLTD